MNRPLRFALILASATSLACGIGDRDGSRTESSDRVAKSSIDIARELYGLAQFDSVRAVLLPLLDTARANHDSLFQAQALSILGASAYREGRYPRARTLLEQAIALMATVDLWSDRAQSYGMLGLIAWSQGRLSDALARDEMAIDAALAAGNEGAVASVRNNMGLVYMDFADFPAARAQFEQMRAYGSAAEDPRREGIGLNHLGMLDVWTGNPLRAIPQLERALELLHSAGATINELNTLGQLGTAYWDLGQPELAIAWLDSSLALAREHDMRQEEASNLAELARIYRDAGDLSKALELYAEAQEINEEIGLNLERGSNLRDVAEIHVALDNLPGARESAERALEIHRGESARWEELADLLSLAEIRHVGGALAAADAYLARARSLSNDLGARTARIDVALMEARLADDVGQSRRVMTVLASAEEDLARGGYGTEWEAHALSARAYARLGMLDSAVARGGRAVAAVERVRSRIGSGPLRTSYLSDRLQAYTDLVTALLQLGDVAEALSVADAIRGRALLEHLPVAREGMAETLATADSLAAGRELLSQIEVLLDNIRIQEELASEEGDSVMLSDVLRMEQNVAVLRERYESTVARASQHSPEDAAFLGVQRVQAHAVQALLQPGEALLEYLSMPDRLLVFVVTHSGLEVIERDITRENLVNRVRLARDLLRKDTEAAALERVARGLYDVLVRPALDPSDGDRPTTLFIVPHGMLNYLPFSALLDGSTGRYLMEDYDVAVLPSAAALTKLRGPGQELETRRASARVFAPIPEQLPATRTEARTVARSLDRSRVYEGNRATERRLREALAEHDIVHVASHAVLNLANPMFSRVQLAEGRANRMDDDGWLEVHEVLGLSIRSWLVFLSGCETGRGTSWSTEFTRAEDYTTLGQAFLLAGARNVVATLWRIDDESSSEFAQRFYGALPETDLAGALSRAQREMLRDPRYRSPYYWAPYQLIGAGGQLERQ